MLMHTRGILVMTPASAMVLTGKQALDFSGAVSAEDNFGIGGYDRIMGLNGQAQYWAPTLAGRLRRPDAALRIHLCGARRTLPPPSPHDRSRRPRRALSPHAVLAESPFARWVISSPSSTPNASSRSTCAR